jgi:hypothetical protein
MQIHLSGKLAVFRNADLFIVSIFAVSLFLRFLIPPQVVLNAGFDDLQGVSLANNLLNGKWLGPWNSQTLLKEPGYSFFLFAIHPLPVEPTLVIHFILLILFLSFSRLILRVTGPHANEAYLYRVLFLVQAFNPALYGNVFSRILRNSLNAVSLFAFITFALWVIYYFSRYLDSFKSPQSKGLSQTTSKKNIYKIAGVLGFTYSVILLTRPENTWPLISLFFGLLVTVLLSVKAFKNLQKFPYKKVFATLGLATIIGTSMSILPISIVKNVNKNVYGVPITNDFLQGEFPKSLKLWESVKNGEDSRYFIPVSKSQRLAVYAVSPQAARLKPYLEGEPDKGWKHWNCQNTGVCDESGGAWFPFELRDAAISAARIGSAAEFQNFFRVLSQEIALACDSGALSCGSLGSGPGTKAFSSIPPKALIDVAFLKFSEFLDYSQAKEVERYSPGNDPALNKLWKDTINFRDLSGSGFNETWKVMANTITTLRTVYVPMTMLMFVLSILSLIGTKSSRYSGKFAGYQVVLFSSIFLFCLGISFVNLSWGFNALNYTMPAQPIFLGTILFGTMAFLARKNAGEFTVGNS